MRKRLHFADQTPLRVLFIGNSYTYYNEIWTVLEGIARADGREVITDHVTKGGWTLEKMASLDDEFGLQAHKKLTDPQTHYDVVFLQEQSLRPAIAPELFFAAVRSLCQKSKAKGAEVVLYQTWGRKTGSLQLEEHGMTNESMTRLLAKSYEAAADECETALSPVGTAFYNVYTNHPEIELYNSDQSHPSAVGTYLAALCHYATIYQTTSVGNVYSVEGLDADAIRILQQAAHDAVFGKSILDSL